MSKIKKHPVLEVPVRDRVIFKYNGQEVEGEKGGCYMKKDREVLPIVW
jgi:co-chaperonin GroES (HSP10)